VSQGQRIVEEIKQIRMALAQGGSRLQKQPKQAAWVIHLSSGKSYRLTYQPAPINAWSLYPIDREASHLLSVIEQALHSQSTTSQRSKA
jgi:hypothetical protein